MAHLHITHRLYVWFYIMIPYDLISTFGSSVSPFSEWSSGSVLTCCWEADGPEELNGSRSSLPDVCQGDVQSGIRTGEACDGPSLSLSTVTSWSRPASDRGSPLGRLLPDTWVTAAAAAVALSDVMSSKGSKMRGRASDDIVASVDSSWGIGRAVSAAGGAKTSSESHGESLCVASQSNWNVSDQLAFIYWLNEDKWRWDRRLAVSLHTFQLIAKIKNVCFLQRSTSCIQHIL